MGGGVSVTNAAQHNKKQKRANLHSARGGGARAGVVKESSEDGTGGGEI
jgi:hypothetical protein